MNATLNTLMTLTFFAPVILLVATDLLTARTAARGFQAFLECVRTRTRPLVSGEDGLAAVELAIRVADAIEESMRRFYPEDAARPDKEGK